jgi:hypothetical protein
MPASIINFSDTTPAAGSGKINANWQNDGGSPTVNVSAEFPVPTVEVVTFTGTAGTLSRAPVKMVALFRNGTRQQSDDSSRTADYYSRSGANITLATAAGGTDAFIAVFY